MTTDSKDELNAIMDRLEEEGETVFQHTYEGSGGLWGYVVKSLDEEFWAYDSGDREPSGPFPDLRSALEENSVVENSPSIFLAVGRSSERISSDLSTEALLDLLDISYLEAGDSLEVNSTWFHAVVEVEPVTGPATRNEILAHLPWAPQDPGPEPLHNCGSTVHMVWKMKRGAIKQNAKLIEAVRTCPLSELEGIVMSQVSAYTSRLGSRRSTLRVLCERMSEHGLSDSVRLLPGPRVILVRG
jgi:hypothetical protein